MIFFSELLIRRRACEAKLAAQSQELELHLDANQIAEYNRLKATAESKTTKLTAELENARQDKENLHAGIQHEQHRMKTLQDRVEQKESECERQKQALINLQENAKTQTQMLETESKAIKELENEVRESKQHLERLTLELQELNNQISDAHGDSMESERNKRRNEAIDNLKRLYPDKVFGRLLELCTPSHKRYNLAVTKVLGGNMMAVVVDTDDTAEECIGYLKEQRYPAEKFLPLNSLDVAPINEKLRELTEPKGLKLLYDVINCTQPTVKKALQFACNNAVVCETPDDARKMAFGRDSHRYKAVALDGTLFQQSGVISGGGSELKQKAKKWDEQGMKKLRDKKKELQDQCNSLHRNRKRELDVEMKRNQISQLQNRIQYTKNETQKLQNMIIPRLELEIEKLKGELTLIQPAIEQKQEELKMIEQEMEKLEKKKDSVSDTVFEEFCKKVGIKDIREYESREMRFHQEKENELAAFNVDLDKLKYEIEFLKSDNRRDRERTEARKIDKLKEERKRLKNLIKEREKTMNMYETELRELEEKRQDLKKEVDAAEDEVIAAKKVVSVIDKDVHTFDKKAKNCEQLVQRRAEKRHALLHECKISGIELPLLQGNLECVMIEEEPEDMEDPESQGTQTTKASLAQSEKIIVDYSSLKSTEKKIKDESDLNKVVEKLKKEVAEANANLSKISSPNLKASERMEQVREKEAETTEEFETAKKKARKARVAFEKVKNERFKLFTEFFDPVAQKIDEIYKVGLYF